VGISVAGLRHFSGLVVDRPILARVRWRDGRVRLRMEGYRFDLEPEDEKINAIFDEEAARQRELLEKMGGLRGVWEAAMDNDDSVDRDEGEREEVGDENDGVGSPEIDEMLRRREIEERRFREAMAKRALQFPGGALDGAEPDPEWLDKMAPIQSGNPRSQRARADDAAEDPIPRRETIWDNFEDKIDSLFTDSRPDDEDAKELAERTGLAFLAFIITFFTLKVLLAFLSFFIKFTFSFVAIFALSAGIFVVFYLFL